jgi:predicted AAA+ superfamily ATPase
LLRLSADPYELESLIAANPSDIIVIDEILRIPDLLNEIHRLIEAKKHIFILTGSSARKLRRDKANLLAVVSGMQGCFLSFAGKYLILI